MQVTHGLEVLARTPIHFCEHGPASFLSRDAMSHGHECLSQLSALAARNHSPDGSDQSASDDVPSASSESAERQAEK